MINKVSLFNLKNIDSGVFEIIQIDKVNSDLFKISIFQIELEYKQSKNSIYFSQIFADLQSQGFIQFLNLNGFSDFKLDLSQILNGSSSDFGGCLNFMNTFQVNQISQVKISNSTFKQCKSKLLGGAISGVSTIGDQNKFIQCTSQIGGAIYFIQKTDSIPNLNEFSENTGYLAANNYNKYPLDLKIDEILEINNNNNNPNNSNLFIKTDQYLYPGLTYIIKFSIQVDGNWYDQYTDNNNFGNLYNFLISPSNNFVSTTPAQLFSLNYPFLIWSAQDVKFNGQQTVNLEVINISLVKLYSIKSSYYKIYNGCKEQGMERVYLQSHQNTLFICKYCEQMKASYSGVCQSCQSDYFSQCYGNYSQLKQSYWRSKYSVESQDIYYCMNNPENCQGGSGIGNELCYEGHIGAQCLNCDIYGTYWNEKYSSVGFFQCVKCNSISSNAIKITILIVVLILSLSTSYQVNSQKLIQFLLFLSFSSYFTIPQVPLSSLQTAQFLNINLNL
ncbi:hypothetical protein TTHERM_01140380 (macronuclear) [Tetrahymena thermophila SB210]|uniref:Transmembrane protein n=1 Tax=Tetrahymena thermophila (strain SB210) TaxID=312017 RepID=Q22SQ3_TETTS|nr:hypothetical protein TTHERM_01140380 [Tetrahymena thermophila SB210]EAR88322.2 hypothetical protein TTHERM_01140380 [Tetrahymena thermophila SB210]|eukprot:XP_001008567.2 hypothetical protein TTHERM_01140380 [Tetrahymena thermophila SB210]